LLKKKIGTICHLIGDPNQNIYQFRRSSSSYLINFPGKSYELTKNFRSSQEIIDFSEDLKPIPTTRSISATGKTGPKVTILTKSANEIHSFILHFIQIYQKDLSNVAIVCPTRGIGAYSSVGLSVFFNLFKTNGIPFNQLYDESGLNDERKKDIGRIPGHINLITYHGTKGLEFDVVFVMDFYHFLFNIKPSATEHKINQYLLYVATSRAIELMYVCTYTNVHSGYLNHWLSLVKPEHYEILTQLRIPHISYREEEKVEIMAITDILAELSDNQLNQIHDYLEITESKPKFSVPVYQNFSKIDRGKDEALFGQFCEELFYLQYSLFKNMRPRPLDKIIKIIESNFVIVDNDSDCKYLKNYISRNNLTWEKYDSVKPFATKRICDLVNKYFTRDKELNSSIICTNEFVEIIKNNLDDIEFSYERYLDPDNYHYNYEEILLDLFYLMVVIYAYENNHYYYINNHGQDKHYLLYNGMELYQKMDAYVQQYYVNKKLILKKLVEYPKLMIQGQIDFIERDSSDPSISDQIIVEIKCVKEISIRYYIQLLLYNFCYYTKRNQIDKIYSNRYKIVNLLTGIEHYFVIKISSGNMFNLLNILSQVSGLKFNGMNLVYDLETTDAIKFIKPCGYRPIIPRSVIYHSGGKFYGKIYPEIIEIAIKDYETEMTIINTLVQPEKPVKEFVENLTSISQAMLVGKPGIEMIRHIMSDKTKNFINCKMMAHNGGRFDDSIMIYEKLVDPKIITFIDTLSLIPMHMPDNTKLDSKKLGKIYVTLFGKKFKAHRAMADVNALIQIMKHLKINF